MSHLAVRTTVKLHIIIMRFKIKALGGWGWGGWGYPKHCSVTLCKYTHPQTEKQRGAQWRTTKEGCCQTNEDYKPTPRRLAQDSQTRTSIKSVYLNHRLTASTPPSLCTQHDPARAPLQTRRRYLCDPCLLASTSSSSFLPQPTEQSRTSQCQQPLGQHLRPYVTLMLRLSSCPEHLIPAFGSRHLPASAPRGEALLPLSPSSVPAYTPLHSFALFYLICFLLHNRLSSHPSISTSHLSYHHHHHPPPPSSLHPPPSHASASSWIRTHLLSGLLSLLPFISFMLDRASL